MNLSFKTLLIACMLLISLNWLNSQNNNENSNSNNLQKEQKSIIDPNYIQFKLNCSNENCGFEILNSNNQIVAVFYGDGAYAFNTYLDDIDWYWKYHGKILFDIHGTPTFQSIYMNVPVYLNEVWSNDTNPIIFGSYTRFQSGGCYVSGWSQCSDGRLKKNIEIIPNALSKILNIKGITFNWRKDEFPDFKFDDGTKLGFIAQDMEKVIPEIVKTEPDGYKSIDYINLTPVLVEAIKEQQKIINSEKEEIKSLNDEIKSLINQMSSLKKSLDEQKIEISKIYSKINNK